MEPINFRFSTGSVHYTGPINKQTHSYLQLLKTIEGRNNWAATFCINYLQIVGLSRITRWRLNIFHLLLTVMVIWTFLDKALLEITFSSDGSDLLSLTRQSIWYMPYFYIYQFLYQSPYAASQPLFHLGDPSISSLLQLASFQSYVLFSTQYWHQLQYVAPTFEGRALGFVFLGITIICTLFSYLVDSYEELLTYYVQYFFVALFYTADKSLTIYVGIKNNTSLNECLMKNLIGIALLTCLLVSSLSIRHLFTIDISYVLSTLQQSRYRHRDDIQADISDMQLSQSQHISWISLQFLCQFLTLCLPISSAIVLKLFNMNTLIMSSAYVSTVLAVSACIKIIMQSCHQNRMNRMYLYLLFLINILPIALIYDSQWNILSKIAIAIALFVPATQMHFRISFIFTDTASIRHLAFIIIMIVIPYGVLGAFIINTLDQIMVYCVLSYYGSTILIRTIIYVIPKLSQLNQSQTTLKSICRAMLKAAAHLQDRMSFECITSLSIAVMITGIMYTNLQASDMQKMYYLSIPVQAAYLLIHLMLIDMVTEHKNTIRIVNVILNAIVIGVLCGLTRLYSIQLLYGFFIESITTFILLQMYSWIQSERYCNAIRMIYSMVINQLVFIPYFVILPIGYLLITDRQAYYFLNCLTGYFQIAVIVFLSGVFIHYVLNLTERVLKSLLVLETIEKWFEQMNIQKNTDKILALWQLFQDYKYSGQKMLKFMKEQKFVKFISRQQVKYMHDYQLVEPSQKQQIIIKEDVERPQTVQQQQVVTAAPQVQHQYSVFYNRQLIRSIVPHEPTDAQIKLVRKTPEYINTMRQPNQYLCRLFWLFSQPNQYINYDMFQEIMRIFSILTTIQQYRSYSISNQMTMQQLRDFLYEQIPQEQLKQWIFLHAMLPFYKHSQQLQYRLFRDDREYADHTVWNTVDNSLKMQQFKIKIKYKKISLLTAIRVHKTIHIDQEEQNSAVILRKEQQQLKDKQFETAGRLYSQLVRKFIQVHQRDSIKEQVKLARFDITIPNVIVILTKLVDFAMSFLVYPLSTIYQYYLNSVNEVTTDTYAINRQYLFAILSITVFIYFMLVRFHYDQFQSGSLGLGQYRQQLTYKQLKYYTIKILFVLGTSLTSIILNNSVKVWLCVKSDSRMVVSVDRTMDCLSLEHLTYMILTLYILLSYYPVSTVLFPYSSAIDRSKQIKYKSEFEVAYIHVKIMLGMLVALLIDQEYQVKMMYTNICMAVLSGLLFVIFWRMRPCSIDSINDVEVPAYILFMVVAILATLCKYIGWLAACIGSGVSIVAYIGYAIFRTFNKDKGNDQWKDHILDTMQKKKIREIKLVEEMKKQQNSARRVESIQIDEI